MWAPVLGIMEYWNNGMMSGGSFASFRSKLIAVLSPIFHHSNIPTFH
jgi:hypothetical protein